MGVRPARVQRLALALPETAEAPHHDMTSFRVAGRIFATMPPDQRHVHVFVHPDEVASYCAEFPGAVEELWWGRRRSGCRVALGQANAPMLRELLTVAWRRRAPAKLRASFEDG